MRYTNRLFPAIVIGRATVRVLNLEDAMMALDAAPGMTARLITENGEIVAETRYAGTVYAWPLQHDT